MRTPPWLVKAVTEATLIVFAVLLALAVDAWWEDRESARLAERTTHAIAGEIRRNRDQLAARTSAAGPAADLAVLDSALAAYRADREPPPMAVNWNVTLLSSAAWETAQINGITPFMELDQVVELAEVYELQRFFSRNQDELASLISDVGARIESEPVLTLTQLRSRLALMIALRQTLSTVYACTLVGLEVADEAEASACPDEAG